MKTSVFTAAAIFGVQALGFPAWLMDRDMDEDEMRRVARIAARMELDAGNGPRALVSPGFDAAAQYVSNTGDHEFQAPGPNDLRGPCPGLNAMANHAYLPRNGVATITQFIEGTYEVFGMGKDLGAFLGIFGAVFDGDLTSWSIGGEAPAGLLDGIGLIGRPQGISGSHNKYESDVSPTRGDLYEYGDSYRLQLSQFEDLYSQPQGDGGYDLQTLITFRAKRFQQSIDNNPNFFNGPFTGVLVAPAAYSFIYRFMGNKSEEYPAGYLDGDVLKSFFSITGEPGAFKYSEGNERIPDNWYKRAIGDDYGILALSVDTLTAAGQHPEFLSVGGNTGKVDTFSGVDLNDLTDGVFNSATLLQGNNLMCFAYQFAQQAAPDILKGGILGSLTKPLAQLASAMDDAFGDLGCPQLKAIDTSSLEQYPGSKGAY